MAEGVIRNQPLDMIYIYTTDFTIAAGTESASTDTRVDITSFVPDGKTIVSFAYVRLGSFVLPYNDTQTVVVTAAKGSIGTLTNRYYIQFRNRTGAWEGSTYPLTTVLFVR